MQFVIPQTSQPETTRNLLYISDLPSNVNNNDLELFFADYKNNIVVININQKRNDYSNNGSSATIIFKDYKMADKARTELNMKKIKGKTVRIMWHERDTIRSNTTQNNLFVKNIPFNVTPRQVYEFFLQFGDILSAKLNEDDDGNHLGYGYINYYQPESVNLAIKSCDGKEVWGSPLSVQVFQKKNERFNSFYPTNCSIYVKDFPTHYSEDTLKNMFNEFGEIINVHKNVDSYNRPFATISYKDEDSAIRAKKALNGKPLENAILFVDILMNKNERKKILSHKIMDTNQKLNQQFKYCNLHIRNIPYNAKDEDLAETFKQYGSIKSAKIEKYMLVTKENNEFKEIPTSKGFGYVCFESPESAQAAKDALNGKFLPGFEAWNRPLLIEFFMPKQERNNNFKQVNRGPMMNQMLPQMIGGYGNPLEKQKYMQMMTPYGMEPIPKQPFKGQQVRDTVQQPQQKKQPEVKQDDAIDYQYLNSLEDDYSKRDYLGEIIFKKIESHRLAQMHNFTIDIIGKITGMILGIEDINEIIDICRDSENLTARITEALELLQLK
jgi:RNA recognition motif-containing protein